MPESPSLFPPHSSPPPLQVLIPTVKLDYSHVQSRCGSLDRRGYSAGGGNVSRKSIVSVFMSVLFLCRVVGFFVFSFSFSTSLYSFPVCCRSLIKAAVLVLFTWLLLIDTAFSSRGLCPARNFDYQCLILQHYGNIRDCSNVLPVRAAIYFCTDTVPVCTKNRFGIFSSLGKCFFLAYISLVIWQLTVHHGIQQFTAILVSKLAAFCTVHCLPAIFDFTMIGGGTFLRV